MFPQTESTDSDSPIRGRPGIFTLYTDSVIDSRYSKTLNIAGDQNISHSSTETRSSDDVRASTDETPASERAAGDRPAITTVYQNSILDSRYTTTTNVAGNQTLHVPSGAGGVWPFRKLIATQVTASIDGNWFFHQ